MANFHDVELLQNALQNAGESAMRRKQLTAQQQMEMQRLALESQLRDIQQSRYDAMGKHFQEMEDIGSQRNAILAQSEADKTRLEEQGKVMATDFANALGGMREYVQTLRANRIANQQDPNKGLTKEDAAKLFNSSVSNLPPELHDKLLQQNPMYSGLASGQIDLASVPELDGRGNPIDRSRGEKPGATQQQIEAWKKAEEVAKESGDPKDQEYADMLKNTLANAPKPTQQTVRQYDEMGHPTNSITSFSLPGAAPAPADDTLGGRPAQPLLPTPGAPPVPANKGITLSPQELMLSTAPTAGPAAGVSPSNTNGVPTGKSPTYPDGTVIQHKTTGQRFIIQNGSPVPLDQTQ